MRKQTIASEPARAAEVDGWNDDFESAPHDVPVLLTPDGEQRIDAMWRPTRRYDASQNQWVEDGYWADPIMRRKLPFEPLGWMLAPPQPKAPMSVA